MSKSFNFKPTFTDGDNSVRIVHIVIDISPSTSPFHKKAVKELKNILMEIKKAAKQDGFDVYISITEYSTNVYPVIDFCNLSELNINHIPFSKTVKQECTNTGEALLYAKEKTIAYYNSLKDSDSYNAGKMIRTPMIFLISDGQIYPRNDDVISKYNQAAQEIKALEHPGDKLDELVTVIGAMVEIDELSEFYQLTNYPERIVHLEKNNIQPFLKLMRLYTCTRTNTILSDTKKADNISRYI